MARMRSPSRSAVTLIDIDVEFKPRVRYDLFGTRIEG
jgi:hypothetical protein